MDIKKSTLKKSEIMCGVCGGKEIEPSIHFGFHAESPDFDNVYDGDICIGWSCKNCGCVDARIGGLIYDDPTELFEKITYKGEKLRM